MRTFSFFCRLAACMLFISLCASYGLCQTDFSEQMLRLERCEQAVAAEGDYKSWVDWAQAVTALAEAAEHGRQPPQLLQELYERGKKMLAAHAGKDAVGTRAKILWATGLTRIAQAGASLDAGQKAGLFKKEQQQLHLLWLHAHEACRDYLLQEETGASGLMRFFTATASPLRDTGPAWAMWWDNLRRFCAQAYGFADADIALTKAVTTLRQYAGKHSDDPDFWLAWSNMLVWQGQRSTDSVVRLAFFEDAGDKYEKVLLLHSGNAEAWLAWQKTLERQVEECLSPGECETLARRLDSYRQKMKGNFP